jgi:hypothetical protein
LRRRKAIQGKTECNHAEMLAILKTDLEEMEAAMETKQE